jgi:hypothetical protein
MREQAALRERWWDKARQVAQMLRDKYGVTRIGVVGDLLEPYPLNYWSVLELSGEDVPLEQSLEIYQDTLPFRDELTPIVSFAEAVEYKNRTVQQPK